MEMLVLGASHFVCAVLKCILRRRCWFVFSLDGSEDVGAVHVPGSRQPLDTRFHPTAPAGSGRGAKPCETRRLPTGSACF